MDYAEKLGWALHVLWRRRRYNDYPVASLYAWLIPAARARQLEIFVDPDHGVIGYMTWALLSESVETKWIQGSSEVWHVSEWNEGTRLWIIDFVPLKGHERRCLYHVVKKLILCGEARYIRRSANGRRHIAATLCTNDSTAKLLLKKIEVRTVPCATYANAQSSARNGNR